LRLIGDTEGILRCGAGDRTGVSVRLLGCDCGRGELETGMDLAAGAIDDVSLKPPSSKSPSVAGGGCVGGGGCGFRLLAELTYACAACSSAACLFSVAFGFTGGDWVC
jgi:hypothetical protein